MVSERAMGIPGEEEGGGTAANATDHSICEDCAKSPAGIDPWHHRGPLVSVEVSSNTNLVRLVFFSKPR